MTPTTPENLAKINALVNDEKFADRIWYLYERWQDEQEYEKIEDYAKPFERFIPEGFKLTKMTKKPFGFQFTIGTEAVYSVFTNSRTMGWKRIK